MRTLPSIPVARPGTLLAALAFLAAALAPGPAARADEMSFEVEGAAVRVRGIESLDESEVRAALEDDVTAFCRHGRNRSCLEDAAYHLKARLWEKGRAFARVEVGGQGDEAVFLVDEGPEVVLEEVRFEGNRFFADEKLEQAFASERVLPLGLDGPRLYVRSLVEDAAGVVRNWYRNEGFLWSDVTVKETAFRRGREEAIVTVSVEEGARARVSGMSLQGVTVNETQLRDTAGPLVGKPFSPNLPFHIRNAFLSHYANQGYPFCRVAVMPEIDRAAAEVFLRVEVTEGRKGYIRSILVEGNALTLEGVVRHVAGLEAGELFRLRRISEAIDALMKSNLFLSVDVEPRPTKGDPQGVDLRLKVAEADDMEITLSTWYDEYEWLMGRIKVRNQNLFGTGRRGWIAGKASFKDLAGEVGFQDPWVFHTPLSATWSWYVDRRIKPTFSEFRWGTRFRTAVEVAEGLELGLEYNYELSDVYDVDASLAAEASQDLTISSLAFQVVLDLRDSPFDPSWGVYLDLQHEFAGRGLGGNVHYDRSVLKGAVYVTPLLGITLAVGGEASIVDPKSVTEAIPLQRRIYKGGAYSVRSFAYEELGPAADDGTPLGGEGCLQLNVELRVPVYEVLGIALFYDTASLRLNAAQWLDFTDFRHGLGAGLRLLTPVGPLRLDFGWNPDRRKGEESWNLHFTVGHAF